jgi:asparagine synthase (glutamine-hydrolysing)
MPVPRGLKSIGVGMLNAFGHKDAFYTELLRRGASGVPVFWGGAEALYESQKKSLLSPALRKQFDGFTSWEALRPYRRFFEENAREASEMNWMTYLDLKYRLPELLLMRVDKMSMAVSLEGRVPFLDHKFVELAMSIPSQMKLKGGTSKYLLKKALRGVIPDEIIDRKKQGFGVPVYEWFQDRLGTKIKADTEEFLRETDWFDADAVRTLVNTGKPSQVWYFYNLVLWWQRFIR